MNQIIRYIIEKEISKIEKITSKEKIAIRELNLILKGLKSNNKIFNIKQLFQILNFYRKNLGETIKIETKINEYMLNDVKMKIKEEFKNFDIVFATQKNDGIKFKLRYFQYGCFKNFSFIKGFIDFKNYLIHLKDNKNVKLFKIEPILIEQFINKDFKKFASVIMTCLILSSFPINHLLANENIEIQQTTLIESSITNKKVNNELIEIKYNNEKINNEMKNSIDLLTQKRITSGLNKVNSELLLLSKTKKIDLTEKTIEENIKQLLSRMKIKVIMEDTFDAYIGNNTEEGRNLEITIALPFKSEKDLEKLIKDSSNYEKLISNLIVHEYTHRSKNVLLNIKEKNELVIMSDMFSEKITTKMQNKYNVSLEKGEILSSIEKYFEKISIQTETLKNFKNFSNQSLRYIEKNQNENNFNNLNIEHLKKIFEDSEKKLLDISNKNLNVNNLISKRNSKDEEILFGYLKTFLNEDKNISNMMIEEVNSENVLLTNFSPKEYLFFNKRSIKDLALNIVIYKEIYKSNLKEEEKNNLYQFMNNVNDINSDNFKKILKLCQENTINTEMSL